MLPWLVEVQARLAEAPHERGTARVGSWLRPQQVVRVPLPGLLQQVGHSLECVLRIVLQGLERRALCFCAAGNPGLHVREVLAAEAVRRRDPHPPRCTGVLVPDPAGIVKRNSIDVGAATCVRAED